MSRDGRLSKLHAERNGTIWAGPSPLLALAFSFFYEVVSNGTSTQSGSPGRRADRRLKPIRGLCPAAGIPLAPFASIETSVKAATKESRMDRTDSFSPVLDTFEDEVVPHQQVEPRRARGRRIVPGAVLILLVAGAGYLIAHQGWAATASQVHGVAEAVRDTGAAVKETSADAATTAKARTALALSKRTSAFDVDVDTTNAVVTLTGKVPALEAKEIAGQIVADTSGVRDVRNLLAVDPSLRPEEERQRLTRRVADLETQTGLSEALGDSPDLDGAKVKVRVVDGAATLDGVVQSDTQRERAGEIARIFPGVQQVINRLR
jgi:osmotically-inducible protein OsmY